MTLKSTSFLTKRCLGLGRQSSKYQPHFSASNVKSSEWPWGKPRAYKKQLEHFSKFKLNFRPRGSSASPLFYWEEPIERLHLAFFFILQFLHWNTTLQEQGHSTPFSSVFIQTKPNHLKEGKSGIWLTMKDIKFSYPNSFHGQDYWETQYIIESPNYSHKNSTHGTPMSCKVAEKVFIPAASWASL